MHFTLVVPGDFSSRKSFLADFIPTSGLERTLFMKRLVVGLRPATSSVWTAITFMHKVLKKINRLIFCVQSLDCEF